MGLWFSHGESAPEPPPAWMGFVESGIVVLNHPDAIRHVLSDNAANYIKGALYDDLSGLLGQGLVTSDGDTWSRGRKHFQPHFHAGVVEDYVPVMVDTIARFLDDWKSRAAGEPVNVAEDMSRLTLRVVGNTLFRVDVSSREEAILRALKELLSYDPRVRGPVLGLLHRYVPGWARIRAHHALSALNREIQWIFDRRGASDAFSGVANDFRDHAATFLIAGFETTAIALSWALHVITSRPDVERAARAEISAVLGDRLPDRDDARRLKYIGMVMAETLRLYPPVPSFGRQAVRDDVIAGFRIKANTRIRIKPIAIHRHPDYWPDPDVFRAERFTAAAARTPYTYIPFGAGPRVCIGNSFAMIEMTLALAMILRWARFTPAAHKPAAEPTNDLTLRPRYGIWLTPEYLRS